MVHLSLMPPMSETPSTAAITPLIRVRRLLGRLVRWTRDVADRLLHPWRRRRALDRLRSMGTPGTALFVCLGNINRSPYAAAAFQRALSRRGGPQAQVRSAGLIGPGRPCSPTTQQIAARRGLDLSGHQSRTLEAEELATIGLFVVMDARQRQEVCDRSGCTRERVLVLGDLDPSPITRRAVQDPYGHPTPVYEQAYARVDRCVEALADALSQPRPEDGIS
jgi:protein-tyrosine phosphatase